MLFGDRFGLDALVVVLGNVLVPPPLPLPLPSPSATTTASAHLATPNRTGLKKTRVLSRQSNQPIMKLRGWLLEHTVEDVLRACTSHNALYFCSWGVSIQKILDLFALYKVQSLLVRVEEEFFWVRKLDVFRCLLDDPHSALDDIPRIKPIRRGLADSILSLFPEWRKGWLAPIILFDGQVMAGIITAADVLRYIHLYGYHLWQLEEEECSSLGLNKIPIMVPKTSSAEHCLRLLLDSDSVGVVGVTNSRGVLEFDVTLSAFTTVEHLSLPICSYLEGEQELGILKCGLTVGVGDLLQRITTNEMSRHHVWLIDHTGLPVGLIGLDDLLNYIENFVE